MIIYRLEEVCRWLATKIIYFYLEEFRTLQSRRMISMSIIVLATNGTKFTLQLIVSMIVHQLLNNKEEKAQLKVLID